MPFISYKYNKPNELNLNLNLERSQKKKLILHPKISSFPHILEIKTMYF